MNIKIVSVAKSILKPVVLLGSLALVQCAAQYSESRSDSEESSYQRLGRLILPAELFDSREKLVILGNQNPITVQLNPHLRHESVLLKITDLNGRAFYDRPLYGKLFLFAKEPQDVLSYINMTAEGLPNDVMVLPLRVEFKILIEVQNKIIFERNFKIEE